MSIAAERDPVVDRVRGVIWVFVTLAGASMGLTLLFLAMRSVMEIGGTCAEGGPFVVRQPCPNGIPLMMLSGIWGGIVFALLYAWKASKYGAPNLVLLAWPALFLSLGYNFLEFGLNPPGGGGLVWGWLVCAVLFGLLGGIPLLIGIKPLFDGLFGRGDPNAPAPGVITAATLKEKVAARRAARAQRPSESPSSRPEAASSDDLVDSLERLDALRRSGALDETEFDAAKRKLLEEDS